MVRRAVADKHEHLRYAQLRLSLVFNTLTSSKRMLVAADFAAERASSIIAQPLRGPEQKGTETLGVAGTLR